MNVEAPRIRDQMAPVLTLLREREDELLAALHVLRRRKSIVIGTVVGVTVAALLLVLQITPRYTANAVLMLNARSPNVVNIASVIAGLPLDSSVVKSEVDVLQSRALAGKVIQALGLMEDPEFNLDLRGPSPVTVFNPLNWIPKGWRDVLTGAPALQSPELIRAVAESEVADAFLRRLEVANDPRSYTIGIGFESRDPEKAMRIANTVADAYLAEQLETKLRTTRRANAWLSDRLAELRDRMRQSEQAVQDFRVKTQLVETTGQSLANQQLSELNSQLVLTRVERARIEAQLSQLRTLEATGRIQAAPEIVGSSMIMRLREQEVNIERRATDIGGTNDAGVRKARIEAELATVRQAIEDEGRRIIESLRNAAEAVRARETLLSGYIDALRNEVMDQERAQLRLAELQREADADRNLFETFLIRTKETGDNEYQEPDARIISAAELPTRPSFPKVVPIVGAVFAASAFLGIFLAFAADRLQYGFRSPDQVEHLTGLPLLRAIPALSASAAGKAPPFQYVLEEPTSAYAEAVQAIRTALHFSRPDAPVRTVLVTSGTSAEGKSTIAISLARMAARSGQKVLLADCDLRRPSIAGALGLATTITMEDLLLGRASLSDAIQRDEASGLHVIPARSGATQPLDLLGSQRMRDSLRDLAQSYDLIVVDSPPVTLVSDAMVVAGLADTTLYLIRWEATPRDVALAGIQQLRRAGADIVGVVLNLARPGRHGGYGYGYGDAAYYGAASKRASA